MDPHVVGTANATFCATLMDEFVRLGVTDVVVCPGSRSTPLALAAAAAPGLRIHVHHDERSGAFLALGLALAAGRPTVVVTTSGTAAVELHPAIVEAHHAHVPLIALTADRPPELQDVGAPQTIDQTQLYRNVLRWFAQPGPPDGSDRGSWRSLAARAHEEAMGSPPGPVQLNLAFREPLAGTVGKLPEARHVGEQAWRRHLAGHRADQPDATMVEALASGCAGKQGVIVAGAGIDDHDGVELLAQTMAWPVLADGRSGCRNLGDHTIAHFDPILRHQPFVETTRPQVVLRLGALPASKVLADWLGHLDAWQVGIDAHGSVYDPHHRLASVVHAEPGALARAIASAVPPGSAYDSTHSNARWLRRWVNADAVAAESIRATLASHAEPTEPQIARDVLAAVPRGGVLVASSSMPVRDLEWFGVPRPDVTMFANRGANGIDGVVSTAVGVALATAQPTVLLIGDVAFLHDSNGLLGAAHRDGLSLTVVVVDNDGGGIFEFLPQARHVQRVTFEQLFGTPHGVDIGALARVHRATVHEVVEASDVAEVVGTATKAGGLHVVHVRTDRQANVRVHAEVNDNVAQALFRAG